MNNTMLSIAFPPVVEEVIGELETYGAKVYLVGGMIRDELMRSLPKENLFTRDIVKSRFLENNIKDDWDFEVFGLDADAIAHILKTEMVGNKTGVFTLLVNGIDMQFSIPRTDKKVAKSDSKKAYMDFEFEMNPHMTIEEAAQRRDFTINAIYYDVTTGYLIDPTGGIADLKNGILRPVSDTLFVDDSVRILRAARFANRFDFLWSDELIELAKSCVADLANQTPARIKIELFKMLETSTCAKGFAYLADIGAYDYILTFFKDMLGCEHDNPYHYEGDVFIHTLLVFECLCDLRNMGEDVKPYTFMAALLHDVAKPITKEYNEEKGHSTFYGHEKKGAFMAIDALLRIDQEMNNDFLNYVPLLVEHHMVKEHKYFMRLLRKYSKEFVIQLIYLDMADCVGRSPFDIDLYNFLLDEENFFKEYEEFVPIVTGKMLIGLDYTPSKMFSYVIDKCAEMQIDGTLPLEYSDVASLIDDLVYEYYTA